MRKGHDDTFVKAYTGLVLARGPPKTSFTLEVTEAGMPLVKNLTIPLTMGFQEASCPFVVETPMGKKKFKGRFCYDACDGGFRILFSAHISHVFEYLGAHLHDTLVFQRGPRDTTTGILTIKVTKSSTLDSTEVTSSFLRHLTLAGARCFVATSFTPTELKDLLDLMDHREVTAFLERVLLLVETEETRTVWALRNWIHPVMCAVLTTAPSLHMGFASLCTICFQLQNERECDSLDWLLCKLAQQQLTFVPQCTLHTYRRFPRTSLTLLGCELQGTLTTTYRAHHILTLLAHPVHDQELDAFRHTLMDATQKVLMRSQTRIYSSSSV